MFSLMCENGEHCMRTLQALLIPNFRYTRTIMQNRVNPLAAQALLKSHSSYTCSLTSFSIFRLCLYEYHVYKNKKGYHTIVASTYSKYIVKSKCDFINALTPF